MGGGGGGGWREDGYSDDFGQVGVVRSWIEALE